jgi:RNA polymerase sigma-70 factor (ECF subfamily)
MTDNNYIFLVQQLKDGRSEAFDQIFRLFYKRLCREARGFFRNDHLVEEVVCDVFLKLWNNRDSLEVTSSLNDYLTKAVYNNCVNYYRALKVQEKLKNEVAEQHKQRYSLADLGQNPLEYIITSELEQKLKEAIESLPPRSKEAFKLSRFQNLKYSEIAIEMGISVDGVKMNIKKALEQLREKLDIYLKVMLIVVSLTLVKLFF